MNLIQAKRWPTSASIPSSLLNPALLDNDVWDSASRIMMFILWALC